jgi:NifU-like protein involved in Fe-S cluster formation
MFDDLADLYQQLILDHNQSPRNFLVLPDADCRAHGINPNCGDNYTLYAKVDGDVGSLVGVHKFPERTKCAILPWHAAMAAIEGRGETVSTEKDKL